MNTVTIKINGVEYNLKGRENQEYLVQVAKYVDGKVKDIMSNNKKLSSTAAATLASLNIADELFKADIEIEALIKERNTNEEKKIIFSERVKEIKNECDKIISEKDKEIEKLKEIISLMKEKAEEEVKKAQDSNEYKEKFEKLGQEVTIMEEEIKKNLKMKQLLEQRNKEIKFQLQNSKYKILDLENKLIEAQISLAKERKDKNVLLK